MPESLRLGVAILAAGSSRRFGIEDKLSRPFHGKLLGEHAAAAIPRERFDRAWVVASMEGHPCEEGWKAAGFETVLNLRAAEGMGTSVALAGELAGKSALDGLLIALADMPLVPREHFAVIIADAASPQDILVSRRRGSPMPPALFGSAHFSALAGLAGDTGARGLLAHGRVIDCPPGWLADIDTLGDLAELE
ncbi:MAG: nucleotidyltransferase family protein [Erythrobacter sp.]